MNFFLLILPNVRLTSVCLSLKLPFFMAFEFQLGIPLLHAEIGQSYGMAQAPLLFRLDMIRS